MPIYIDITNIETKESFLYEREGRKGNTLTVPAYRMILSSPNGYEYVFDVTRDSTEALLGKTDALYGVNDECPPNKKGQFYKAIIRADGPKGFRLQLYEEDSDTETLRGVGPSIRKHIQIHGGPGYSNGCILITGDTDERDRFKKSILRLLEKEGLPLDSNEYLITVTERKAPKFSASATKAV